MHPLRQEITRQVQQLCHIADARHGGDFTMCTYLLKMREYYRWECRIGFNEPIPKEHLGDWLTEREQLWSEVAEQDFVPLEIEQKTFDPFDTSGINRALEPHGLVYSAGLINGAKAHFFLGDSLHKECQGEDFMLHVAGTEYARCLNAPPAMTSSEGIFLRRESLTRYLWEKYESWLWNRPDNALGRAFGSYPFDASPVQALEQMTERELNAVLEHERGEYAAGLQLGPDWNPMVLDLALTQAELMVRAVRDHLADSLNTIPFLMQQGEAAAIHFYVGNLSGMRKHLFPQLEVSYRSWVQSGDMQSMRDLLHVARRHWSKLAADILELYRSHGAKAAPRIKQLCEQRKL